MNVEQIKVAIRNPASFLIEWVKYTPHFFTHAPICKWWMYFSSSWRIAVSLTYTESELQKSEEQGGKMARHSRMLELDKCVKKEPQQEARG